MAKNIKLILLGLLGVFVLLQFFQIDKRNPTVETGQDLISMVSPPADVSEMLKQACYDCHSHQTTYPWYANIQPVGWWLKGHIDEGREHLNFSTWAAYDAEKKAHKAEECAEEVEESHMPIKAYTFTHAEARLDDEQRKRLVHWFEALAMAGTKDISEQVRESVPKDQLPKAEEEGEEHEDGTHEH
jgi:hypothetical protein